MGTDATSAGFFKRLVEETKGGIGMIVGLSLPVVIGAVGLAFDINRGLEQRVANQRAADMAALGAAMAYKASKLDTILKPTAIDLARANGLPGATVDAAVVNDFPNAGDKAVKVTVTSQVPYTLARVLGLTGNYDVAATSVASLNAQAPYAAPCFLALTGEKDALTTNGGASIAAPDCSVAAIGSIDNGGGALTAHDIISGSGSISTGAGDLIAETLRYATSFSAKSGSVPPEDRRYNQSTTLVDPWATDATLLSARTQLGDSTALPAFSDPDTSCSGAENWSLDWNHNSNPAKAYWTGSGYNIPAGTYCIKKLTVGGGLTVKFGDGSNISVSQGFANGGGSTVNFGNSDLRVNGGFDSGSSGVTIGNGLLWIGQGNIKFQGTNYKGDGNVMINDTLSLDGGQKLVMGSGQHYFGALKLAGGGSVVMGEGDLVARDGIDIGGGSELSVGDGNITVGAGSGGNAIKLSGSARFFMGDGEFSANGDIDTAGGSRIVFGRTANHYINGDMKIAGSALFGAGRYTVNGDFWNGTGGTVWPYTSTLTGKTYGQTLEGVSVSGFDMVGVNVSFILSGSFDLAGGARTKLVAGQTTTSGGVIANLLVDSLTSDKIDWTGGSANVFEGTVHFPNAEVKMAGGNSTSGGGGCFTLIASYIKLTGGAVAGSACPEMSGDNGSSSASTIRLLK